MKASGGNAQRFTRVRRSFRRSEISQNIEAWRTESRLSSRAIAVGGSGDQSDAPCEATTKGDTPDSKTRFITEVFNEVNGIKPSRTPADEATATDVVALQRLRSRVVAVVTAMAP